MGTKGGEWPLWLIDIEYSPHALARSRPDILQRNSWSSGGSSSDIQDAFFSPEALCRVKWCDWLGAATVGDLKLGHCCAGLNLLGDSRGEMKWGYKRYEVKRQNFVRLMTGTFGQLSWVI